MIPPSIRQMLTIQITKQMPLCFHCMEDYTLLCLKHVVLCHSPYLCCLCHYWSVEEQNIIKNRSLEFQSLEISKTEYYIQTLVTSLVNLTSNINFYEFFQNSKNFQVFECWCPRMFKLQQLNTKFILWLTFSLIWYSKWIFVLL